MYTPGHLDQTSLATLSNSLRIELIRLVQHLNSQNDSIALRTLHAEPTRTMEGMVVKADGTNWNPGGGAGVYAYIGGSWVKL